jgi:hypothetical protein
MNESTLRNSRTHYRNVKTVLRNSINNVCMPSIIFPVSRRTSVSEMPKSPNTPGASSSVRQMRNSYARK